MVSEVKELFCAVTTILVLLFSNCSIRTVFPLLFAPEILRISPSLKPLSTKSSSPDIVLEVVVKEPEVEVLKAAAETCKLIEVALASIVSLTEPTETNLLATYT